ncbi:MAG TPA: glycoside hydrolase family 36 protein [Steroidobacteraceae bacterium]
MNFDPTTRSLHAAGITLSDLQPLIDGQPAGDAEPAVAAAADGWTLTWRNGSSLDGAGDAHAPSRGNVTLQLHRATEGLRLDLTLESTSADLRPHSFGLRIGSAEGVSKYLRNGYTSWDGSYFVEPAPEAQTGYAMTALLSQSEQTAVLGFLRHDRFQSRLRFALTNATLSIDVETLTDGVAHDGQIQAEPLILLAGTGVEETLRSWARLVAAASPLPPRLRDKRITGWCSWYSLYASISEPVLLEHLRAAARFRDNYRVPFEVFQIDDGFTPEMGDWLELKPQFPRGMAPLLTDIRDAGFVPGLWIAPFMVGNRSKLYAAHPDWVVTDRSTGKPLAPMKFYGEFRWHKRSEEYYILDITHPEAEAYIRNVFRVWTRDWGCRYFKTDFMYFGSEYGPDQARWHQPGLSRMAVWMRMARLIREEIGESLWLGCGAPIWAPIGLMDAVRIGRDVGVSWKGNHSAESLLRDQTSRNFANGILWQADPDCILLRSRFHELTDGEVRSLALFAGLSGGLLMTSDQLDEVSEERRQLLARLIGNGTTHTCSFPRLGQGDSVLVQQVTEGDGTVLTHVFNTGDHPAERSLPGWDAPITVAPHESQLLTVK